MEEEVALGETERGELATGARHAHDDDDAHDEDVVGDEDDDDYRISHLLS